MGIFRENFFSFFDSPKLISHIVGGGSAGCRLAESLSASGKYSVLLLEAGGVPPESSKIPTLALLPYNSDKYDWKYKSVPQETSMLAAKNKAGCDWLLVQIELLDRLHRIDLISIDLAPEEIAV